MIRSQEEVEVLVGLVLEQHSEDLRRRQVTSDGVGGNVSRI